MRKGALLAFIAVLLPSAAMAGFSEARNVIGVNAMFLSGPQKAFYRELGAWISPGDRTYPAFALGMSFRSFGTSRLGAEVVFSYASKSGSVEGLGLSTIQAFLGPVYSIPLIGSGERVIPYGTIGVALVRTAVDIDSQTDVGLYAKLGLQGVITEQFGITAAVVYTGLTIHYRSDKGLGKAGLIDESHSFGDAQLVLELNYFP